MSDVLLPGGGLGGSLRGEREGWLLLMSLLPLWICLLALCTLQYAIIIKQACMHKLA